MYSEIIIKPNKKDTTKVDVQAVATFKNEEKSTENTPHYKVCASSAVYSVSDIDGLFKFITPIIDQSYDWKKHVS